MWTPLKVACGWWHIILGSIPFLVHKSQGLFVCMEIEYKRIHGQGEGYKAVRCRSVELLGL